MTTSAVTRSLVAKRRSSRLALNARIGVSGEDQVQESFSIAAQATNLNRYGAAIQLTRELLVGATVMIRNQRGARISARIVAHVSAANGLHTYGIEFVEEDSKGNFWGISFPPAALPN